MAQIIWTPWRNREELLKVRRWLFPSSEKQEADTRRKACSLISAWKLRGGLPHAVESTWHLTDATLADNIPVNGLSPLAVRACYVTAFCRFVTGLVDTEQIAKYKLSMYDKAKELALPASFVELRHEAIHGELPSLVVLRQAVQKSLLWLWDAYWKHIDNYHDTSSDGRLTDIKDEREPLRYQYREVLRAYVKEMLQQAKFIDNKLETLPTEPIEATCLKVYGLSKGDKGSLRELAASLLEYKMLIPPNKSLGQPMDDVFAFWDPLLKSLICRKTRFLTILIDTMAAQLTAPSTLDASIDIFRESIFMWLEHIFVADSWNRTVKLAPPDDISLVSTCLQSPNHWTLRLATSITESGGHKAAKDLLEMRIAAAVDGSNDARTRLVEDTDALIKETRDDTDGWFRCQGHSIGKPIGVG